jgi:hypothetical protein
MIVLASHLRIAPGMPPRSTPDQPGNHTTAKDPGETAARPPGRPPATGMIKATREAEDAWTATCDEIAAKRTGASCPAAVVHPVDQPGPVAGLGADERGQ